MSLLNGQCHCGRLQITFETEFEPAGLPLRACQCSFCRLHGVVSISDARGAVSIHSDSRQYLHKYRFGLEITDFLLCTECGVYVAALMQIDGKRYASINANVLEAQRLLQQPARPVDYSGENTAQRLARRKRYWTPAVFTGTLA